MSVGSKGASADTNNSPSGTPPSPRSTPPSEVGPRCVGGADVVCGADRGETAIGAHVPGQVADQACLADARRAADERNPAAGRPRVGEQAAFVVATDQRNPGRCTRLHDDRRIRPRRPGTGADRLRELPRLRRRRDLQFLPQPVDQLRVHRQRDRPIAGLVEPPHDHPSTGLGERVERLRLTSPRQRLDRIAGGGRVLAEPGEQADGAVAVGVAGDECPLVVEAGEQRTLLQRECVVESAVGDQVVEPPQVDGDLTQSDPVAGGVEDGFRVLTERAAAATSSALRTLWRADASGTSGHSATATSWRGRAPRLTANQPSSARARALSGRARGRPPTVIASSPSTRMDTPKDIALQSRKPQHKPYAVRLTAA